MWRWNMNPECAVVLSNQTCLCANTHQTSPLSLSVYFLHPLIPAWLIPLPCHLTVWKWVKQVNKPWACLPFCPLGHSYRDCVVESLPLNIETLPLLIKDVWAKRDPQQLVRKGHNNKGDTLQLHILSTTGVQLHMCCLWLCYLCGVPVCIEEMRHWT